MRVPAPALRCSRRWSAAASASASWRCSWPRAPFGRPELYLPSGPILYYRRQRRSATHRLPASTHRCSTTVKQWGSAMDTSSIPVAPGPTATSPGRSFSLKLRGGETGDSIMMFEETVPAGTTEHIPLASRQRRGGLRPERRAHLQDRRSRSRSAAPAPAPSCRAACRMPGRAPARETGRVLFLYTPAKAGGLIEEQQRTGRRFGSMNERRVGRQLCERHRLGSPRTSRRCERRRGAGPNR